MDALIAQFFNLDIMAQAAPLILRGLGMTLLVCRRGAARPRRRAHRRARRPRAFAHRALLRRGADRPLPRRAAAGALDLHLCRAAVRRSAALAVRRGVCRLLPQHVGLLRRDLPGGPRERRRRPARSGALHRPDGVAGDGLRRDPSSRAQRAARPRVETPWRWSSSPRSRVWSRFPRCSIPQIWRARSPTIHRRSCLRR